MRTHTTANGLDDAKRAFFRRPGRVGARETFLNQVSGHRISKVVL